MLIFTKVVLVLIFMASSSVFGKAKSNPRQINQLHLANYCISIKNDNSKNDLKFLQIILNDTGITLTEWNNKYTFEVECMGTAPILFAASWSYPAFIEVVDSGINLNHPIIDEENNIYTIKDYVKYKAKNRGKGDERGKYLKMYRYLLTKNAKTCKEQQIQCTESYL